MNFALPMKWLLRLGFVLALAGTCQAQETRIAAVVNNDIVTLDDVGARLLLLMRSSGIPDTPQNRQQLQRRVLQQLIDEKLEIQEAKRYKVVADKNEVERALEVATQEGFRAAEAICIYTLGVARWALGDLAGADELLTRSLEVFRGLGDSTETVPTPMTIPSVVSTLRSPFAIIARTATRSASMMLIRGRLP